jgi:SAM-dependent methyltransferase
MLGAMRYLNVGCGDRFDPTWTNLDLAPRPGVVAADLRQPLPFDGGEFDAVYASHVLEHLDPDAGGRLLGELFRVLKPGGIVRIVVPDLEQAAREYLAALAKARAGDARDYDWAVVELVDQLARSSSGGRMARLMRDPALRQTIERRVGAEALAPPAAQGRPSLRTIARAARWRALGLALGLAGGREAKRAFDEGRFRALGEVHRWMYDSDSLGRALQGAGFVDARVVSFAESRIAGFSLDAQDGKARKPDSLYMEAVRPA